MNGFDKILCKIYTIPIQTLTRICYTLSKMKILKHFNVTLCTFLILIILIIEYFERVPWLSFNHIATIDCLDHLQNWYHEAIDDFNKYQTD